MNQIALHKLKEDYLPEIREVGESILKVLAYFDIFHYPLKREEIKEFMDQVLDDSDIGQALSSLLEENRIYNHQDHYSLHDNPLLVIQRLKGNRRAEKMLPKAKMIGRFLHLFPFVQAVGISGSLSKNFANENSDIDFFIITRANRLWIARTCMHLFKKLTYITGHQQFFCMNYYVDETALELGERNIYSAIELKTLLPVSGKNKMQDFFNTNQWASEWLPACGFRSQKEEDPQGGWLKKAIEWIFHSRTGDVLDNWLMKITVNRWKRKETRGACNGNGHTLKLITGKHFARSDAGGFQDKVLDRYREKLEAAMG